MPTVELLAELAWNEWLTIAALVISGGSISLAYRADRRAGRAEKRGERDEFRDEERIKREREEADAANRAQLAIWPNPNSSGASVDDQRFGYVIRNHGKATAFDVHVWLYDKDFQDRSIKPQDGFDLAPDESVDNRGVTVPLDVEPLDVRFGVRWFDGAGFHRRTTNMPPAL